MKTYGPKINLQSLGRIEKKRPHKKKKVMVESDYYFGDTRTRVIKK